MDILLLRFDAPLISFGAPIVDNRGEIQPYPALSMLCGMLGNALGYDHSETNRLQRLQERLQYASRQDKAGERIRDYQTVDLGQEFMSDSRAWTTRGKLEERKGGSASSGTHIRLRDYWADSIHTVALTLQPADEAPTMDEVAEAIRKPERPLFIGRKTCLPATPILLEKTDTKTLRQALKHAPVPPETEVSPQPRAWWPSEAHSDDPNALSQPVTDARDWENQIHVGERWIASGQIKLISKEKEDA
ncbi:MAG: type I-E CRISPR-associated protein Cas5/CasD [Planctomycetes bacterium]|nr:type I-E CRISPR-associated protein Cas5/CasD [Planctomycetota bacterium]